MLCVYVCEDNACAAVVRHLLPWGAGGGARYFLSSLWVPCPF